MQLQLWTSFLFRFSSTPGSTPAGLRARTGGRSTTTASRSRWAGRRTRRSIWALTTDNPSRRLSPQMSLKATLARIRKGFRQVAVLVSSHGSIRQMISSPFPGCPWPILIYVTNALAKLYANADIFRWTKRKWWRRERISMTTLSSTHPQWTDWYS